jgi:hypothetical protein
VLLLHTDDYVPILYHMDHVQKWDASMVGEPLYPCWTTCMLPIQLWMDRMHGSCGCSCACSGFGVGAMLCVCTSHTYYSSIVHKGQTVHEAPQCMRRTQWAMSVYRWKLNALPFVLISCSFDSENRENCTLA